MDDLKKYQIPAHEGDKSDLYQAMVPESLNMSILADNCSLLQEIADEKASK